MTTAALVPVEEYLTTAYDPDCDYVGGHIEERNVGEFDHGRVQLALLLFFAALEQKYGFLCVPEQRIQIDADHYRVADVCLIRKEDRAKIIARPPILCVEVLSPEDRHVRLMKRLKEYLQMGVKDVWVIDPELREAYIAHPDGLHRVDDEVLRLTDYDVKLKLADLFQVLD